MPHLILEYSANIADSVDDQRLLKQINKQLADTKLFSLNDIKSRVIKHSNYVIGDGGVARAFVTINLSILSGREATVRKQLSELLLEILKHNYPKALASQKLSLTVQISEMDKACYGKLASYDD